MTALTANNISSTEEIQKLHDAALDITGAAVVQIELRGDRKVLWVNVNGVCVLRICNIKFIDDHANNLDNS